MEDPYLTFYSRPEIQQRILETAEDREVAPRYNKGFGRRPDVIEFPGDILEMAKKGATSFHISEERWHNPLALKPGMDKKDLDRNRKGWDLCLPAYEKIFIRKNGKLSRIDVSDLAKRIVQKEGNSQIDALSVNPETYKIEYDRITKIFVRKPRKNEKIFSIELEDGRTFIVSEDHPVLVFTPLGLKEKKARLLNLSDYFLIPKKIPPSKEKRVLDIFSLIQPQESKYLYPVGPGYVFSKFLVQNTKKPAKNPSSKLAKYFGHRGIPLNFFTVGELRSGFKLGIVKCQHFIPSKILLNRKFGFLIGLYLAESGVSSNRVEFVLHRKELHLAEELVETFNTIFKTSFSREKNIEIHRENTLRVRINSQLFEIFFVEILGLGKSATGKNIPTWVFNSTPSFIDGLLEGYFVGDGHIRYDRNDKSICFSVLSVSKQLIEGIGVLLLLRGICYKIRKDELPQKNSASDNLRNIIRISGEREILRFRKCCPRVFREGKIRFRRKKTNHPSIHERYPPFYDRSKISKAYLGSDVKRVNLLRAIRKQSRVHYKLASLVANPHLKKIISSDVFPIRCKTIKVIKYSGLLYDIQTERNHNFLQGDGIFTHNCLDIDTLYWDYAKWTAYFLIEALKFHDVQNIFLKFSGGKGFHIVVPFESFPDEVNGQGTKYLFPEGLRVMAAYLQDMIHDMLAKKMLEMETLTQISTKTGKRQDELLKDGKFDPFVIVEIDTVLISNRHLFRSPYSLHEKSGLVSVPVGIDKVLDFDKHLAEPQNVTGDVPFFQYRTQEKDAKSLIIQAFDWWAKKNAKRGPDVEKKMRIFHLPTEAIGEEHFPDCINKLLEGNMGDGKKRALFILVNFLKHMGWPRTDVEAKIKEWNRKNPSPLSESYVAGQLQWHKKQQQMILPPNCKNKAYYQDLRVKCKPIVCTRYKNPVNCAQSRAREAARRVKKKKVVKKVEKYSTKDIKRPEEGNR